MNLACTICIETILPATEIRVTKCGHMFHMHCLHQWLTRSPTCPQCRRPSEQSTLIKLYLGDNVLAAAATTSTLKCENNLLQKLENLRITNDMLSKSLNKSNVEVKALKLDLDKMNEELESSSLRRKELERSVDTLKMQAILNYEDKKHHHPTTPNQRKGGNYCTVCLEHVHAAKHCQVVESIMDALEDLQDCQLQLPYCLDFNYINSRYCPYEGDYYERKSQLIKLINDYVDDRLF